MMVSVITPTWRRNDLLLDRCIPSVRAQTWPDVEHIVISDGPDPALRERIAAVPVRYVEMPEHVEIKDNFGSRCRTVGLDLATGEIIAYIDDDNAWRPEHLAVLVDALQSAGADFAYSRMIRHGLGDIIGAEPPALGQIDTSLLVHHRGLPAWPMPDHPHADWNTVRGWLGAGHSWVHVPEVTVDYYLKGMATP